MPIPSILPRSICPAVVAATAFIAPAQSVQMRTVNPISLASNSLQAQSFCGWMGVKVSPMTAQFADSLGMAEPHGAIFDRPEPGSPAASAGIEAGDVVTAVNGSPLTGSSDFAAIIAALAPGSMVYLSIFRNGEMIEVRLVLGSATCSNGRHGATGAKLLGGP